MPTFTYTAVTDKGERLTGTAEASDRSVVVKNLTEKGLKPLSVKEGGGKKGSSFNLLGGNKVKSDALVIFTRELSAMVGAGVPLLRALNSLYDHAESAALKKILAGVIKDIEGGDQLGDALAKYPQTFSDVYINMVRAGEAAGILDDILKRLAFQQ